MMRDDLTIKKFVHLRITTFHNFGFRDVKNFYFTPMLQGQLFFKLGAKFFMCLGNVFKYSRALKLLVAWC
jgi:hypothetical protein